MSPSTEAALRRERTLLQASTATAAAFAVVGIAWGWWAESQVILLDGAYALIGLGLGLLSLRAARLVEAGPTPDYPFGREALAPLIRLSYLRMALMALPYTVTMTLTGLVAVIWLL